MKKIIEKYRALPSLYRVFIAILLFVLGLWLLPHVLVYALAALASYKLIPKKVLKYTATAVFFFITIISGILLIGVDKSTIQVQSTDEVAPANQTVVQAEKEVVVASTTKTDTSTIATAPKVQEVTQPPPAPTPAAPQATVTKTDREKAIEIIKANASAKWGTDYQMVNYTVKNQTAAYDWVVKQTQYPDIMVRAKNKWNSDYEMVKYTYENQVAAYEWIARQTAHPDIMARAKQKWGGDYEMVKYEYENQVSAYEAQ